jgi:hypothetical protein
VAGTRALAAIPMSTFPSSADFGVLPLASRAGPRIAGAEYEKEGQNLKPSTAKRPITDIGTEYVSVCSPEDSSMVSAVYGCGAVGYSPGKP